jgi:FkbM family methyltransferase
MFLETLEVCITAYKEGTKLLRAWNSILEQEDPNWLCTIILDGGADQETQHIFGAIDDKRLKKIKLSKNIGPYPTREIFLKQTDCEIPIFLDADDYFDPQAFKVIRELFSHSSTQWISASVELIFHNQVGKELRRVFVPGRSMFPDELVLHGIFPGLCVFRKRLYTLFNNYDPYLYYGSADFDFMLSILEMDLPSRHSLKVIHYKEEIECSNSVSRSYFSRFHQVREHIVTKHPETFSNPDVKNFFLASAYKTAALINYRKGNYSLSSSLAISGEKYFASSYFYPFQLCGKLNPYIFQLIVVIIETYRYYKSRFRPLSRFRNWVNSIRWNLPAHIIATHNCNPYSNGEYNFYAYLTSSFQLKVIFDIGARTDIFYAENCPLSSKILLIEPNPSFYQKLSQKLIPFVNQFGNNKIIALNIGLGSNTGELGYSNSKQSFVNNGESQIDQFLPILTLDDICGNHEIESIDFLKLDVEGFEKEVLKGAKSILSKTKIVQFEAGYTDTSLYDTYHILRDAGFQHFYFIAPKFLYLLKRVPHKFSHYSNFVASREKLNYQFGSQYISKIHRYLA